MKRKRKTTTKPAKQLKIDDTCAVTCVAPDIPVPEVEDVKIEENLIPEVMLQKMK